MNRPAVSLEEQQAGDFEEFPQTALPVPPSLLNMPRY